MASMAKGYNARYLVAKAWHAVEELVAEFAQTSSATAGLAASARRAASAASSSASSASAAQAPGASASSPGADFFSLAMRRLQTSWESKLTLPIYMAGAAMAPALNKAALKDRDALEKLVVRCIARPSARSVFVGDVVAFTSPLTPSKDDVSNVLVRRVAAVDGDELVAPSADGKDDEEEVMEVPKGHCWVLADNSDLRPPQVIDSRTFGHIPMANIIGRVIYAGTSEAQCGPVANNPLSMEMDQAIIDAEVEPAELFAASTEGSDSTGGDSSRRQ